MIKDRSIGDLISDESWTEISTAGRVLSFSKLGNISFGKIIDSTGAIQFSLKKNSLGENYKAICSSITRGKHIAISGTRWITGTGEVTIDVTSFSVIQEAHSGLADKWEGLNDTEKIYRERYRDVSVNLEAANVFHASATIIKTMRMFLWQNNFEEFTTPILSQSASGAAAKPFITHSNALDKDFYLRIAPECALKMIVGSGFDNVFEIGQSFRNEGLDRSHVSEFTSLEWYSAYKTYEDNKILFLKMLRNILINLGHHNETVTYGEFTLDFSNIQTVLYRDLFVQYGLQSPDDMSTTEADELFKKVIRPNLIQPIIVQDYPAHMSPLAERKADDDTTVAQWQLIVAGQEIVKCYNELTNPRIQRQLLEDQVNQRDNGNEEAMMLDETFLDAMSYGFPPMSGLGIGIQRLTAILTNKPNIRDVIFFPMMG